MKFINKIFLIPLGFIFISACTTSTKEKECCKKNDSTAVVSVDSLKKTERESIYQLDGEWVDQNYKPFKLIDLKGEIQVVAMVFTNCGYACPRIVGDMQLIESKILKDKKDKVHFLLVSFDTEKDTPERLTTFAKEMGLNKNWTLLHGKEEQIREISLVLGVKYDKQTDGSFAHSNIITILDSNGLIVFQQEGLGTSSEKTIEVLSTLLR